MPLDPAPTYKAILEAAREGRWVTRGDIRKAHKKEKTRPEHWITSHLQKFLSECYARDLPILGVMVVNESEEESGDLMEGAVEGIIKRAREVGYHERGGYEDLAKGNFDWLAERDKVFRWAKTAPLNWHDILSGQSRTLRSIPSRLTPPLPLDLALTYKAIWEAAREGLYITYLDIASAHGRETLGQGIALHLQKFMEECCKKDMPILGVMVVPNDEKVSGELTPEAVGGTIGGARQAGYHEEYLSNFNYRVEQDKIFKWAETALPNWNDIPYRQPHKPRVVPLSPQPKPAEVAEQEYDSYTVQNIIDEGCFLEKGELEKIKARWTDSKNLILQGPPGTGKTWLAKRLGKALIGSEDSSRIRVMQFHPSTSYEDFVLGYRPAEGGKLELVEGVFLQVAKDAEENKGKDFVLVIEEINRGRPAQIFGELLTLIENTKRNSASAMQLAYHRDGQDFYVPDNLYIIGTMNLADRSLAMVDIALRRRFAFYDLKPRFGKEWKKWCKDQGVDEKVINEVRISMKKINKIIKNAPHLGKHFCLGHSYFTPEENDADDVKEWIRGIIENNLMSHLEEYSVNNPKALKGAKKELKRLLKAVCGDGDGSSGDDGDSHA